MILTLAFASCAPDESTDLDTGQETGEAAQSSGADYSVNATGAELLDVHGAGAQRSDPKTGDAADYAGGHGPQGDVVRIDNYVRCVRGTSTVLPDTGQTACYGAGDEGEITCPSPGDDVHGQDGNYTGAGPTYIVDGDVVTDQITGLTWTTDMHQVAWDHRESAAAAMDAGGYDDWRVPSTTEAYSLINFSGATGTGDPSSSAAPADAIRAVAARWITEEG